MDVLPSLGPSREQVVDANPIIESFTRQAIDPEHLLDLTEKALAMVQKNEAERLKNYATYVQTVIAAKQNDPDEVDKRDNNKFRRGQKALVGTCGAFTLIGAIVCAALSAPFVLTSALMAIGLLLLVITTITSSGAELSTGDVVKLMNATRRMLQAEVPSPPGSTRRKK
ncbi:hypothetical protein HUW63_08295 [Myxococcus sp. AM001]|nr:hypothetical protein [Myxococcus sp. AM001]